jgi:Holliday junction resolvase
MPNHRYQRGRVLEYRTKEEWEARDYQVVRTAGSHGPVDLVAWNKYETVYIQVKSGKVSKSDLADFADMVRPPAARKLLVHYVKIEGKYEKYITEVE